MGGMVSTKTIICAGCGASVVKVVAEINRAMEKGRRLFCGASCAARTSNAPRRVKQISLICLNCGTPFNSTTHNKAAKSFCSRACASKGSMTDYRRQAQQRAGLATKNLWSSAETLKHREDWKYALLKQTLNGREFEFEFKLGDYVFDLALLDTKTLVEFDGPYHMEPKQIQADDQKEDFARAAGFTVIRRKVVPSVVIDPTTIQGL